MAKVELKGAGIKEEETDKQIATAQRFCKSHSLLKGCQ